MAEPELKPISEFDELDEQPADGDLLPIVDISEPQLIDKNKRITFSNLVKVALNTLQSTIENQIKDTVIYLKVVPENTLLTVLDGVFYWTVPSQFNDLQIVDVAAAVYTPSSSGNPTFQINKAGVDILSTRITIDATESTSYTAATPPVINSDHKTLTTGQIIRIDVDITGTGTRGLDIIITVNP